jgi:hypothetical protein
MKSVDNIEGKCKNDFSLVLSVSEKVIFKAI